MTTPMLHAAPARTWPRWGAGAVAASFLLAYAGVLATLVTQWRGNNEFSHGFLVPFMSLYLLWARRDRLASAEIVPDGALGWPVTALGLTMLVLGQVGGVAALASVSLLVTLTGVVLVAFGRKVLRVAAFPIAFLIFMIPVWSVLTERLHLPFQLLAANGAVALLDLAGIPAHRQGVVIELPNVTLEVARVCSGINYLIAVLAVGVLLACLYLPGWWRRAAVVGFALAVGALSNSVRVALIGGLAYHGFEGPLHGPGHFLQSMSVSAAGYVAIFAGLWVLSPRAVRGEAGISPGAGSRAARAPRGAPALTPMAALSAAFLLVTGLLAFAQARPRPLAHDFDRVPARLGAWRATEAAPPLPALLRSERPDAELARLYLRGERDAVWLSAAHYDRQVQGREVVSYRTDVLHEGAEVVRVDLEDGAGLEVNRFTLEADGERYAGIFWYVVAGEPTASRLAAKARTVWGTLRHRRADGALVVAVTRIGAAEAVAAAVARVDDLVREAAPALARVLPRP